jgi:hypothetical protein
LGIGARCCATARLCSRGGWTGDDGRSDNVLMRRIRGERHSRAARRGTYERDSERRAEVGEYRIYGVKRLEGTTFEHEIWRWNASRKSRRRKSASVPLLKFFKTSMAEVRAADAAKLPDGGTVNGTRRRRFRRRHSKLWQPPAAQAVMKLLVPRCNWQELANNGACRGDASR